MQAEVRKGRVGSVVPKERWRLRCRCSGKGRQWQEGCAAAPRPSRRTLIIVSWFQYLPVDRVSSRSRRGNWGSLSEDSADFTITWAQVLLQMTEWFSPRTSVYTHTHTQAGGGGAEKGHWTWMASFYLSQIRRPGNHVAWPLICRYPKSLLVSWGLQGHSCKRGRGSS